MVVFEFGDEIKAGVTNKLQLQDLDVIARHGTRNHNCFADDQRDNPYHADDAGVGASSCAGGTVITDSNGKAVTKITITPIPIDRPPFPLTLRQHSHLLHDPARRSIHFGKRRGAGPKGARLFYPNNEHKKPGVPYAFWNYDPDRNGWHVYGERPCNNGSGTQVVPDPGVLIYEFSGAMVGSGSAGPNTQGSPGDNSESGEPVQLSSGLFVYNKTDLVLPDVIPISLTRTYRPNDSWSRPFGIGATHPYEMFIGGDGQTFLERLPMSISYFPTVPESTL